MVCINSFFVLLNFTYCDKMKKKFLHFVFLVLQGKLLTASSMIHIFNQLHLFDIFSQYFLNCNFRNVVCNNWFDCDVSDFVSSARHPKSHSTENLSEIRRTRAKHEHANEQYTW